MVYLARIAMGTAERRGLSRWLGLLSFVPLANIVAYPYFAFHDGFRAPNKAGLVLGLLLAFGPLPGQIAMVNALTAHAQEAAQSDLGNGVTLQQAMGGLGAAMEIGAQLSAIEQMDPTDPEQAARMSESIAALRDRLAQDRAAIGEEVAVEMDRMLREQETRLQASGTASGSPQVVVAASNRPAKPAPRRAAPPAPPSPPLTASIQRHGDDGFAVPVAPACPPGTELRGAAPPAGTREWCERVGVDAGIKHGWMTEYHDNGNPAVAGEYRDGLRVGVWTRYYEDGTKRAQAEFEDGLQHGVLISWGPDGSKIYEQYFEGGAPASR